MRTPTLLLLVLVLAAATNAGKEQHDGKTHDDNVYVVVNTTLDGLDSIIVEWTVDQNVTNLLTYTVTWSDGHVGDSDGEESVDPEVLSYTITDLDPCTKYAIEVLPNNINGPIGKPGQSVTTTGTPVPDPVTNLNISQLIHDFGLGVSWSPIPPPGNCDLSYTVTWSLKNGTEIGQEVTQEPQYSIVGLHKDTPYDVCVTSNLEGETAADPECDDGYTIMSRLWLVLDANATSIKASWSKVEEADSYRLSWTDGTGGGFKGFDGSVTQYTIEGLQACDNYSLSLTARVETLQVDFDEGSVPTLAEEPNPVTSMNVTQEGDESELTVTWPPVTPPGKCDLKYTVTWTWSDLNVTEGGHYETRETLYLITNLTYNTEYSVCVHSWVTFFYTEPVCTNVTVIDKRLNLVVVPDTTRITVHWSLIDTADSYYLWWKDDHSGSWVEVDGTTNTYVITNLQPCGNYSVQINALQGSENMKNETACTRTLPTATTPVSDLSLTQMIREPGLGVTWSSVPTPGYCNLNYKINWSHLDNTEDGHDTTTDLQYNITNLEYGTEYTVCVVSSVEGEDAEETCQIETTNNNRLGLYLEATSTTILVYWNQIEGADSYYIAWTDGFDGAWTSVDNTENYIINDLNPGSNYTVVVEARNGEAVLEVEARSIFTLSEVSSVINLNVIQTSDDPELTITWSAASTPGQRAITYRVTWSNPDNTQVGHTTTSSHRHVITDLMYDTTYTVCVTLSVKEELARPVCINRTIIDARFEVEDDEDLESSVIERAPQRHLFRAREGLSPLARIRFDLY